MKRPEPAFPTILPLSYTTSPRRIVVFGNPVTSMPAYDEYFAFENSSSSFKSFFIAGSQITMSASDPAPDEKASMDEAYESIAAAESKARALRCTPVDLSWVRKARAKLDEQRWKPS